MFAYGQEKLSVDAGKTQHPHFDFKVLKKNWSWKIGIVFTKLETKYENFEHITRPVLGYMTWKNGNMQ